MKCSSAIHSALEKYNQMAPHQSPSWPILQFSDIAPYSWLGDFDLLKFSGTNIIQKPWSIPANHEIMNKYFKVVHAHEEIHHLNIEICRLVEDPLGSSENFIDVEDEVLQLCFLDTLDVWLYILSTIEKNGRKILSFARDGWVQCLWWWVPIWWAQKQCLGLLIDIDRQYGRDWWAEVEAEQWWEHKPRKSCVRSLIQSICFMSRLCAPVINGSSYCIFELTIPFSIWIELWMMLWLQTIRW